MMTIVHPQTVRLEARLWQNQGQVRAQKPGANPVRTLSVTGEEAANLARARFFTLQPGATFIIDSVAPPNSDSLSLGALVSQIVTKEGANIIVEGNVTIDSFSVFEGENHLAETLVLGSMLCGTEATDSVFRDTRILPDEDLSKLGNELYIGFPPLEPSDTSSDILRAHFTNTELRSAITLGSVSLSESDLFRTALEGSLDGETPPEYIGIKASNSIIITGIALPSDKKLHDNAGGLEEITQVLSAAQQLQRVGEFLAPSLLMTGGALRLAAALFRSAKTGSALATQAIISWLHQQSEISTLRVLHRLRLLEICEGTPQEKRLTKHLTKKPWEG